MAHSIIVKEVPGEPTATFEVEVMEGEGSSAHIVHVDPEYKEKIDWKGDTEALVKKSFAFLLRREPKESILREFNLNVIQKYFPEYEEEVHK